MYLGYTVECLYRTVQIITILYTALRWQQQNVNQTHNRHPIAGPHGRAMGCLLWEFWRKLTPLYRAVFAHTMHFCHWHWDGEMDMESGCKMIPNRNHRKRTHRRCHNSWVLLYSQLSRKMKPNNWNGVSRGEEHSLGNLSFRASDNANLLSV